MSFTVLEIARQLGGEVRGDGAIVLNGFAPADRAQAGNLTFAENETFFQRADASAAAAILVAGDFVSQSKTLIHVANARIAFAKVLGIFYPEPVFAAGVHPTAVVATSARIDATAHIGPHCVIGAEARIGARATATSRTNGCTQLGQRVRIHSGTVIGSDGFGYVIDAGVHRKVPQIGNVVIGDDVEIGANVTVDRGALGPTTIGKGTKIDNLVQIAHNVKIGRHCIIVSQTGISGSSQVGDYVVMAGQVGVAGHCTVGDGVILTAQSGISHDIPAGKTISGSPGFDNRVWLRAVTIFQRLPELLKRLDRIEKKLAAQTPPEDAANGSRE